MDKVIVLPNAQEIMDRLKPVNTGLDDYTYEKFAPLIAAEAGRALVAEGVVMMFVLKIHDFVQSGYPASMEVGLHMFVPMMIDALIDDKEVAERAKAFHKKGMDEIRQS